MTMKRILLTILAMVAIAGCQNNSIAPKLDCSLSDLDFTATITDTDCGLETGIIDILASAGQSPYSYNLDGEATQESAKFESLGAGEYNVKVTDNLGCTSEKVVVVANNSGLTVSTSSTTADCGNTNGSIKINASNGVEPYQYQLDEGDPQASPDFIVGPGIYIILITDNNGCEFTLSQLVKSNTSYGADILPIMANSCAINGCHDGSNSTLPNFNNLIEVQANASMIKSRTQSRNMPKTGSLTQDQIDLIACWVDDGALEN
jgi:hypothetical protein